VEPTSCSSSLFEHDLFGKPVSTFPDHAIGGGRDDLHSHMLVSVELSCGGLRIDRTALGPLLDFSFGFDSLFRGRRAAACLAFRGGAFPVESLMNCPARSPGRTIEQFGHHPLDGLSRRLAEPRNIIECGNLLTKSADVIRRHGLSIGTQGRALPESMIHD